MSKTQKTILIYGLSPAYLLQLNLLAEPAGFTVRAVSDSQTACHVGQLLAGTAVPASPMHLLGKFAVLDGFGGQEQLAVMMINQVVPGVVKAVHTAHNTKWRFCDLCAELSLEHQTMNKR